MPSSAWSFSCFYRTKGMGEIFHGPNKGLMFVCDQLHVINISFKLFIDNKFVCFFTRLSYPSHKSWTSAYNVIIPDTSIWGGRVQVKMKRLTMAMLILFILFSFVLNILGLMKIFPIYISSPILFLSVFIFITFINDRKKFKGF